MFSKKEFASVSKKKFYNLRAWCFRSSFTLFASHPEVFERFRFSLYIQNGMPFTIIWKLQMSLVFLAFCEFDQICIKMHCLSRSSIWDEFFTNIAYLFEPFHPCKPIRIPLQTVQSQMRGLIMSCLATIYTVCHSDIDFWLKPLFATMDVSKFRGGRVHFINTGERVKESQYLG